MAFDDELDRLYGLPLDEFTAARNELAKRLRKEGDKEEADRVRELSKPSVAAWTVNQLARRRSAGLKKLLGAADELRAAHERALGGSEGAEKLRSAAQRERELVAALRRDARDLLAEAGRSPTDATLERVATTLSGAARDAEARPLLEAGRLTEEVATTGFDAFTGMALPTAPAKREAAKAPATKRTVPSREDAAAERRRAADAKKRAAELRKHAEALEKKAQRAERDAEQAAERAERAAEEAERARAAADEARAEADEAEAEGASS